MNGLELRISKLNGLLMINGVRQTRCCHIQKGGPEKGPRG